MYIYTYEGKAKSPEDAQRICDIFARLSSSQLATQPGYRRGECAVDADDRRKVFIHEHWGSLSALQFWLASEAHHRSVEQAKSHLEGLGFANHLFEVLSGGPS